MKSTFSRFWDSPTLMTWLNTVARVSSLVVVLPLVLRQFSPGDIALYYLFASIISLQLLAGSGFLPTFSRFVTYALAGATEDDFQRLRAGKLTTDKIDRSADAMLVSQLVGTLRRVFLVLALGSLPVIAITGSLLLRKPVNAASDVNHAWLSWLVVLGVTPLTLYANQYSSLLQGVNRIALEQRWSASFVVIGSLSGFGVLLGGGGLLALVTVNQFWQIVSFLRLRWLARRTLAILPYDDHAAQYSPAIFRAVWPSSWKSFIGVAASGGIVSASGLIFAQRLDPVPLAEFLLGVRIMSIIAEVSRAPFYSKLPRFNSLRARDELAELAELARRGMKVSFTAFLVLFVAAPLGAAVALPLIGSQIAFPRLEFWLLFGLATLVERWGAMHIQIYSTTNDIIWHWLNGATGLLWIGLMAVSVALIGLYAYPAAMLVAYVAVYSQISFRRSVGSLRVGAWDFERCCGALALVAFLLSGVILA